MKQHIVSSVWQGGMKFNTTVPPGVNIVMDANEEGGGKGKDIRPKALMLASLAGCTAMDIASLLKKMRAEVDNFDIEVSGFLSDEHPKYYKDVHIIYNFHAKKFKEAKIEKSVKLSVERYCGVMEMFRQFANVTHEIKYHLEE